MARLPQARGQWPVHPHFLLAARSLRPDKSSARIFLVTLIPFPFLYAALYSNLSNSLPKPQYLLLMAAVLCTCVALAADGLRIRIASRSRLLGATMFLLVIVAVGAPMAWASYQCLEETDKRDWRGIITHLSNHAADDDAFAVAGSNLVPSVYDMSVFGRSRYGMGQTKFVELATETSLGEFDRPMWRKLDGVVWLLVYRDLMCTGRDQIDPIDHISV